jgi:hypothetical protein
MQVESDAVRVTVDLFPVHFPRTFSLQRLGPYDPTADLNDHSFRKAFFYRGKAAAVEVVRKDATLELRAFGEDAEELSCEAAEGMRQRDGYGEFTTEDTGVLRLHRMLPGLRVIRVPWLYDMTVIFSRMAVAAFQECFVGN